MNILDDYKTVLIVGNGFDLSLKYPTSYSDFIASKYFKGYSQKKTVWLVILLIERSIVVIG